MHRKQHENSMMSWSANFISTIITTKIFGDPVAFLSGITEEDERVAEIFGCVIIVLIEFVDQDIIEFSSSCVYIYT